MLIPIYGPTNMTFLTFHALVRVFETHLSPVSGDHGHSVLGTTKDGTTSSFSPIDHLLYSLK